MFTIHTNTTTNSSESHMITNPTNPYKVGDVFTINLDYCCYAYATKSIVGFATSIVNKDGNLISNEEFIPYKLLERDADKSFMEEFYFRLHNRKLEKSQFKVSEVNYIVRYHGDIPYRAVTYVLEFI